jgi:hypothetical protein
MEVGGRAAHQRTGCGPVGRAPARGAGGRRFEPGHPDARRSPLAPGPIPAADATTGMKSPHAGREWVPGSWEEERQPLGVVQLGRTPRSGRGGREFESPHPDFGWASRRPAPAAVSKTVGGNPCEFDPRPIRHAPVAQRQSSRLLIGSAKVRSLPGALRQKTWAATTGICPVLAPNRLVRSPWCLLPAVGAAPGLPKVSAGTPILQRPTG